MCGICGVVYSNPGKPVDRETLGHMTDIMSHRGPDNNGFFVSAGVGLGVRRLSIIDLQTGDQPISNEDGSVTIVCNGEIYNFQELRKHLLTAGHRFKTNSDVEVITFTKITENVAWNTCEECSVLLFGMPAAAV